MKSIKKSFLLLSITASLAFGSCNIYSGIFSSLFCKPKPITMRDKFFNFFKSESFDKFKAPLFVVSVAIPLFFLLNYLFKDKSSNINPAPTTSPGPDKEKTEHENTDIKGWRSLPDKSGIVRDGSLIKQRSEDVIEVAKLNNILMNNGEPVKVEVALQGGKKVQNNVYQVIASQQHDISCGPRAVLNAKTLSEVFDFDFISGTFVNSINKLADLEDKDGEPNPKMLEFFKAMQDANIFRAIGFDEKTGAPQGPEADILQKFVVYCSPENKKNVVIKNVDVMPGYDESFDEFAGERLQHIGSLAGKKVGESHGYALLKGRLESFGNHLSHDGTRSTSLTHYITIFAVKISENEYNWFIADSLNSNQTQSDQVKAYIHKLLGSNLKEYEDMIKKNKNEQFLPGQIETFNEIKAEIESLKTINKDIKDQNQEVNNLQINISQSVANEFAKDLPTISQKLLKFFEIRINRLHEQFALDQKMVEDMVVQINEFKAKINLNDSIKDDKYKIIPDVEIEKEMLEEKQKEQDLKINKFNCFKRNAKRIEGFFGEKIKFFDDKVIKNYEEKQKIKSLDRSVFDSIKNNVNKFLIKNKSAENTIEPKTKFKLLIKNDPNIAKDKSTLELSDLMVWANDNLKILDDINKFMTIDLKEKNELKVNINKMLDVLQARKNFKKVKPVEQKSICEEVGANEGVKKESEKPELKAKPQPAPQSESQSQPAQDKPQLQSEKNNEKSIFYKKFEEILSIQKSYAVASQGTGRVYEDFVEFLDINPQAIHEDKIFEALVFKSAQRCSPVLAKKVFIAKKNIDIVDFLGNYPLHLILFKKNANQTETVLEFLKAGADLSKKNKDGISVEEHLRKKGYSDIIDGFIKQNGFINPTRDRAFNKNVAMKPNSGWLVDTKIKFKS